MKEFTAKKVTFQGETVYIFKQFQNGKAIVEQLIPAKIFDKFCEVAGISTDMIDFIREEKGERYE